MSKSANASILDDRSTSLGDDFDSLVCEISEKIEAGANVNLDEYVTNFPHLADRLRRIWPTLLAMADLGHLSGRDDEPISNSATERMLGDFRIIREVGRGGMGVVYEATQVSLGRRVALKVLPFASVMDNRQLQRFKNEAMAAAALDHPNIVRVFTTGCERSVHFYAMHFVDGPTLSELIEQLRESNRIANKHVHGRTGNDWTTKFIQSPATSRPADGPTESKFDTKPKLGGHLSTESSIRATSYFRAVANMGRQAAAALDYAHSLGIVHRDIKPSNLILDDSGQCWITDFGLALIDAGSNLTMTGDLLGTLRYMSPEQALAKRVVIDHRTDVYSLGVTLYELLTLVPAHLGDDREQLLRRLAFEEPTRPGKLNSAVPDDLETIVLKAIAKNPSERYATAADMADDLQRYLEQRPIRAKRPGLLKKFQKWTSRHKSLSITGIGLLTIALIFSAWLMQWQAKHRSEVIALVGNDLAAAEASLTARDLEQSRTRLIAATARLEQARLRHQPSHSRLHRLQADWTTKNDAQERLDRFREKFNQLHATSDDSHATTINKCISALREYDALSQEWKSHPDFEQLTIDETREVKHHLAEILFLTGWLEVLPNDRRPSAIRQASSKSAIDYWSRIRNFANRPVPAVQLWMADAFDELGESERAHEARETASQQVDQTALDFYVRGLYLQRHEQDQLAIDSLSKALRKDPGHIWSLRAIALAFLDTEKPALAEAYYLHVLDRFPDSRVAIHGRGLSLINQRKFELAVDDFEHLQQLAPEDYTGSFWAGKALIKKGDFNAAKQQLERAVELNPESIWAKLDLAKVYIELEHDDLAEEQLTKSIDIGLHNVKFDRGVKRILPAAYQERAKLQHRIGELDAATKDIDEAKKIAMEGGDRFAQRDLAWFLVRGPVELRDPVKALPLAEASVEQYASPISLFTLAVVYYETNEYQKAIDTAERIIELNGHYSNTRVHFLLAASFWQLDEKEEARLWYSRGIEDNIPNFRSIADQLVESSASHP